MAKPRVLVDTSGFYALLVRGDSTHRQARSAIEELADSGMTACTTDYIVDETATLLKARGLGHLNGAFFTMIDSAEALTLCFIDSERFRESRLYFERYSDHACSFTDCTSFVLMRETGITRALTKDQHFSEAGFKVLLDD